LATVFLAAVFFVVAFLAMITPYIVRKNGNKTLYKNYNSKYSTSQTKTIDYVFVIITIICLNNNQTRKFTFK
jgi:hypothetical protein